MILKQTHQMSNDSFPKNIQSLRRKTRSKTIVINMADVFGTSNKDSDQFGDVVDFDEPVLPPVNIHYKNKDSIKPILVSNNEDIVVNECKPRSRRVTFSDHVEYRHIPKKRNDDSDDYQSEKDFLESLWDSARIDSTNRAKNKHKSDSISNDDCKYGSKNVIFIDEVEHKFISNKCESVCSSVDENTIINESECNSVVESEYRSDLVSINESECNSIENDCRSDLVSINESECNSVEITNECESECNSVEITNDCESECNSVEITNDCESECNSVEIENDCESECNSVEIENDCESECNSIEITNECGSESITCTVNTQYKDNNDSTRIESNDHIEDSCSSDSITTNGSSLNEIANPDSKTTSFIDQIRRKFIENSSSSDSVSTNDNSQCEDDDISNTDSKTFIKERTFNFKDLMKFWVSVDA